MSLCKKVNEQYKRDSSSVEEAWKSVKEAVLGAAKEICGETEPGHRAIKETW